MRTVEVVKDRPVLAPGEYKPSCGKDDPDPQTNGELYAAWRHAIAERDECAAQGDRLWGWGRDPTH